ncbi:DUF4190 domain-containing protein [Microbacterium sp.]|uniref:DUF4190 domain-containing protein n=1 Tax=Microbacterium sp. TaxID=51671 RepID=UPI00281254AE|nr:DUF4190 domain-containing protein [Microbacterium sp.]
MSDDSIPTPAENPSAPPAPPAPLSGAAAPPPTGSYGAQPTQAYPGAAPSYPPAYPGTTATPYPGSAASVSPSYPAAPQAYPGAAGSYPSAPQVYGSQNPQPSGYPAYGAAPAYPGYAQPRPTSGLAITALVCGLAGLILSWLIFPVLASVAAVITGHMALGQTKKDPALGGRGMALAGLILGYAVVGIILLMIVLSLVSMVIFGAFTLPFLFSS